MVVLADHMNLPNNLVNIDIVCLCPSHYIFPSCCARWTVCFHLGGSNEEEVFIKVIFIHWRNTAAICWWRWDDLWLIYRCCTLKWKLISRRGKSYRCSINHRPIRILQILDQLKSVYLMLRCWTDIHIFGLGDAFSRGTSEISIFTSAFFAGSPVIWRRTFRAKLPICNQAKNKANDTWEVSIGFLRALHLQPCTSLYAFPDNDLPSFRSQQIPSRRKQHSQEIAPADKSLHQ